MSRGVIYAARGEQYINEAIMSAKSVKSINPDLGVTLFSGENDCIEDSYPFDTIETINGLSKDVGASLLSPEMLRYDKTLFLDTDTHVCEGFKKGFELLGKYDLCASHNPGCRISEYAKEEGSEFVPDAFPQFNTGVVFLSDNAKIGKFLEQWRNLYIKYEQNDKVTGNQTAFREAAYYSNINISTLPPEYNTRVRYKKAAGALTREAKIIHGRNPEKLQDIAEKINSFNGLRVYTMKEYPLEIKNSHPSLSYLFKTIISEGWEDYTYRSRFTRSIKENGVKESIRKSYDNIKKILWF